MFRSKNRLRVLNRVCGANHWTIFLTRGISVFATLCFAAMAYAQSDPWSTAAANLSAVFTGAIAKGFSLVAIVLGGLGLAFSEGGSRRAIGGLIFGLGLALGATQFMTWLLS